MSMIVLADPSGEGAKAGPWGLAVILVLCVACYFLFKSMSKHLKKVREEFPSDEPGPAETMAVEPGAPEPDASESDPGAPGAAAPGTTEDQPAGPSLAKAERTGEPAQPSAGRPPGSASPRE